MNNRILLSFLSAIFSVVYVCQVYSQDGLKVYISADMEGISGVVHRDQTVAEGSDYNMARSWFTQEVNSAIQGAIDAGAKEIIVNDSHGSMRNILPHELNPVAKLITGSPKPLSMMEGFDKTFDAVFFIGYHARAGSKDGVLDHTYSGSIIYSVKMNGVEVGESEINAAIAGLFGVPVVLVTGDKTVCEQVKNSIDKNIVTVDVKESIGRYAGKTITPSEAQKKIREMAKVALQNRKNIKPYVLNPPYQFDIEFLYSEHADNAELIPDVKRTGSRSVTFVQNDLLKGFRLFRAILLVARPG